MGRGGAWSDGGGAVAGAWDALLPLGLGFTSGPWGLWGLTLSSPLGSLVVPPLGALGPLLLADDGTWFWDKAGGEVGAEPGAGAGAGSGSGWLNLFTIFFTFPEFLVVLPRSICGASVTGLVGSWGLGLSSGFWGRGLVVQTAGSGADILPGGGGGGGGASWLAHSLGSKTKDQIGLIITC